MIQAVQAQTRSDGAGLKFMLSFGDTRAEGLIKSDKGALAPPRCGWHQVMMLHCFFDDSGTHADSKVAVWGGVVGTTESVLKLNALWKARLAEPVEGRGPIRKFGLADLRARRGEFANYREADVDRARYLFRECVLQAGIYPFSFAVDCDAYDRVMTAEMPAAYRCNAAGMAFGGCADTAIQLLDAWRRVRRTPNQIVAVFDQGQRGDHLDSLLGEARSRADAAQLQVTYTFAKVGDVPALQAADMVATESYWRALGVLAGREDEMSPHYRALVEQRLSRFFIAEEVHWRQLRQEFEAMPTPAGRLQWGMAQVNANTSP
jgi:hypothetical protein